MKAIRGVQPGEMSELWPKVAPLVARALSYAAGDHTPETVRIDLEQRRRQLFITWPAADAILITAIEERPARKVLQVFALAGRLPKDWREALRNLETWAAEQGCAAIELQGRPGWTRRLPEYRGRMITLRKELAA
jgi:hypothetical protein